MVENLIPNILPNKSVEQYFFTENTLESITSAFEYIEENEIICLCTPMVADYFYSRKGKNVLLLDCDERFSYLPKFHQFDLVDPVLEFEWSSPRVLIVDPPFFNVNLVYLKNSVDVLTKKDFKTCIAIAFVIREEKSLLSIFKEYNLKLTKLKLEYADVDATKWDNYGLYSNFEMGKIKFIKKSIKKSNKK